MTRIAIQDFSLANPLYIGKTLSFYTVDANGARTATLATLYAGPTGTDLLENPQDLDSEGKTRTPVYIEDPVMLEFTNVSLARGQTGIVKLFNASGHNISKGASVQSDDKFLTTVSASGEYLIGYYVNNDGSTVDVTYSGVLS